MCILAVLLRVDDCGLLPRSLITELSKLLCLFDKGDATSNKQSQMHVSRKFN